MTARVDLPIRCACGELEGTLRGVTPDRGNRCVCYCDDCQSFAHFLGRPREILDAHGGTEIFQTTPALLEIVKGADRFACMRLTSKGLLRWYARCCRTPVGNTLPTSALPFVGVIRACIAADDAGLSAAIGPVRGRVMGRFAKGDPARLDLHQRVPLAMLARFLRVLITAWLRGDQKRSPFFDPGSGQPVTAPEVLTREELGRVVAARDS
jgi:hypothetical protein